VNTFIAAEQAPVSESSLSTTTLQRVLGLDAAAWRRVDQLYRPVLYSKCRRCGVNQADAADLVQEVLLAAYKGIATFRRDEPGSSFRAWLLGIASNKLGDYWRAKAKDPQAEGGSEAQARLAELAGPTDASSTMTGADDEKAGLVRRAVELLQGDFQDRTWRAFWRFEIDEQPAAAVAVELGMTANAVHVAVCRVRKRLRDEFAGLL
jgi:RNA polymerase sigma-70 factor (ECF subfamily)